MTATSAPAPTIGTGLAAPTGPLGPPVPAPLARLRRAAVLQLVRSERRRVFPALLHVGTPGGLETVGPARAPDEPLDHALRVEVLCAMLRRVGALPEDPDHPGDRSDPGHHAGQHAPLVWLTRTGQLELQDVDAGWLAATRAAAAETGVGGLDLLVVTRDGWWDPATGSGRRWRRLRGQP